MEQECRNICIVGAGAAGCMCAHFLLKKGFNVTLFDKNSPLRTLLPTGGGRCNLAHSEFDFRELTKNYPRGEKFLYSVFSKFSTSDTLEFFENIGVKTYTQEDGRIFPESNSAKDIREKVLKCIKKAQIKHEEINSIEKTQFGFLVNKTYPFDKVIIATGGRSGYSLVEKFGIKIIPPKPSLVGLCTKEAFKPLSGTVLKNVSWEGLTGDILFTHFGVSGPLIYKISSIKAFAEYPYDIVLDLGLNLSLLGGRLGRGNILNSVCLQADFNKNPHKTLRNILGFYFPIKFVNHVFKDFDLDKEACKIDSKIRDSILNRIHNFKITITKPDKGEETVTAGGVDLDEINSKTMECKKVSNLYCIGEVLNIDGFCGGFNLQNAWSTAYVCATNMS